MYDPESKDSQPPGDGPGEQGRGWGWEGYGGQISGAFHWNRRPTTSRAVAI
jgi:hypothetical protein